MKTPISLCLSVKRSASMLTVLLVACGGGTSGLSVVAPDSFHGITVPPEPDAVANSTLLGVDSNVNGVRDDVERLIVAKYGANANELDGAMRAAQSDQEYLIANGDPVKSTAATINAGFVGACMFDMFGGDGISSERASNYISPLTFNTPERMAAYRATSAASTEITTPIPTNPCL
jgi:hypothetical protein